MIVLTLLCSCEKEYFNPDQQTGNIETSTRNLENPCKDRLDVDYEGLMGGSEGGFSLDWHVGELDRLLQTCAIGQVNACKDFKEYQYKTFCCFALEAFDTDGDGLFSPNEQDVIIGFIMDEVKANKPSCLGSTIVAIDTYLSSDKEIGFTVKYLCCAGISKI